MRTKMKMRLLSVLLCFVMLLGMIPTATYAGIRDELDAGFTTQPQSGTALITEGYAYTWELSIVPGMQALQVLNPLNAEEWITLGTLKGNSDVLQFPGVEYVRNGKSVYRVAAAAMDSKGNISEYYSDSFIVTWTEGYTVSFDANGGTGTMAGVSQVYGEYTLPACTFTAPEGKMFKSWSVDGVEKNAGDTITVTADTTVTAVWKYLPVIYTVSFNANGGTGTMSDVEVEMGEYTLPVCTFTAPEGKEFWCWNVGGEVKQPGDVINVTTDFTAYAEWRVPSAYTKLGEVSEVTVTAAINPVFGAATTAPGFVVTAPTGKGVSIANAGWYKKNESDGWDRCSSDSEFEAGTYCLRVQLRTDTNFDNEYYALVPGTTLTVNGTPWTARENSYYDYYYYGGFGWIWFQSGEYTVEEVEEKEGYIVSFDANGGTGTMADVEVEMGEYTLPVCTFTAPEGKELWGWKVNGEVKMPGDVIDVTTDVTVYAQWRLPSEYTKLGEVSEVTATATINPVLGETVSTPDFVVTAPTGKGVDIVNVGWYKKNESGDWVRYSSGAEFEVGTYCLRVQLRTDKNSDNEYYALTTDTTLTVNGTPWTEQEDSYYDNYYSDGYGWNWFQSAEYTVAEKEGLIKNPDTGVFEYYVDGELATDYSGTVENAGYTWYVINGILDSSYTGIRYDGTDFWYVNNGKVNTTFVGLYNFADAWWYVKDGKIQKDYKGMVDYSGYTWYVANGKVDITFTGLGLHEGVWYCVQAGKVNMSYSGLVLNGGSWWYVTDGVLDTSVTGIVETGGSQWLVGTGKLQSTYTGTYTQGDVTYNIVNGKVVS